MYVTWGIHRHFQIKLIEDLSTLSLKVKVEKRGRLNRIRVTGRTEERNKAVRSITKLLQEMQKDKMEAATAATLFKTVRTGWIVVLLVMSCDDSISFH